MTLFQIHYYGSDEEELIELNLVDRKRMRGGPEGYEVMDTPGDLKIGDAKVTNNTNTEAVLSGVDCAASSLNVLATPAMQASRPQ